jgi:Phage integrase family
MRIKIMAADDFEHPDVGPYKTRDIVERATPYVVGEMTHYGEVILLPPTGLFNDNAEQCVIVKLDPDSLAVMPDESVYPKLPTFYNKIEFFPINVDTVGMSDEPPPVGTHKIMDGLTIEDVATLITDRTFSLWTGYAYSWREDELLDLRVRQLDFIARIIDLGKTKNGDQRMITMTEHVFRILVRCVHGKKTDDFVFTREDGSPVRDFRDAWWNACIRAGLGRFQCRDCQQTVTTGRKCNQCNSKKKAKYVGLHFHDLRRTGIRNMSRKGIPENVGMLISGHKTNSVYRRYNIIDMEVIKEATTKIEEHQRALKPDNDHRTTTVNGEHGTDDKTDPVN